MKLREYSWNRKQKEYSKRVEACQRIENYAMNLILDNRSRSVFPLFKAKP